MRIRTFSIALCLCLTISQEALADQKTVISTLKKITQQTSPSSGALVYDSDQRRVLFSWKAKTQRIPASLEKLYTTAAVLKIFGGSTTLNTLVASDVAPNSEGVIKGNLYLIGSGDPSFGDQQLDRLAQALSDRGVTQVEGKVVGDTSLFDMYHGGPATNYQATSDLGGSLSALLRNRGLVDPKDPAQDATKRFVSALRTHNIAAKKQVAVQESPLLRNDLLQMPSPPLRELIQLTNTPSDNFFAEMLLKLAGTRRGKGSSSATGRQVVSETLTKQYSIQPRIVDGSGLSRQNRTSPADLLALLQKVSADPAIKNDFYNSLAIVGKTGTLKTRMRHSAAKDRCRAKTGTLSNVSSLAGYCTTQNGRNIVFVFMMNQTNIFKARQLQDKMVVSIAGL